MEDAIKERLNTLRRLATGKDFSAIKALVERFEEAAKCGDRTAMSQASKEALELEKKYIPRVDENSDLAERLKCESLIMTVGFQKEPLVLSILCLRPKKVVLLHTEGSRNVALDVEGDPAVQKLGMDVTPLFITEYDAEENYRVIRDGALPRTSGVTVIDPTGGRKVMVASLALAAFYHRFPMVYLHTLEREGVAVPFTETLRHIENPFDFFGDIELKLAEEQFNCHLYEAAFKSCEELLETIRDPASYTKVSALKELFGVFRDWDSFLHSSVPQQKFLLSTRLREVIDKFRRLGIESLLPEGVENNLCFLRELDNRWKDKRNIVDEFRLVDIFVGALRRGSEKQGKYDDAVARLYRCLEMCSSLRLKGLGLEDVERPDYERFATGSGMAKKEIEDRYRNIKVRRLPTERLGLDDQMTLLVIVGERIAKIYESMKRKRKGEESLMEVRNRSPLAHGTNPVTERHWPEFRDKTKVVIENTIGGERFQELLSMAMHGRICIAEEVV